MAGLAEDYVVPGKVEFTRSETPHVLTIVFGRSQTEQAMSPAHAVERSNQMTAWKASDGQQMIIKESDDITPGPIGNYVVSREGTPLSAQIVLRAKRQGLLIDHRHSMYFGGKGIGRVARLDPVRNLRG
jgi:hypothetical protein